MLFEVSNVQQVRGEPLRRWFFSDEQDLLIWFDGDGKPVAFQLSYGKYRDEHAIRWEADRGFTHYTAPSRVVQRFTELSFEVPSEIAEFVAARLREHPEHQEDTENDRC